MYGNGFWIGIQITLVIVRRIRLGLKMARSGSIGAVLGIVLLRFAVRRTAAAGGRVLGTTIWGFGFGL